MLKFNIFNQLFNFNLPFTFSGLLRSMVDIWPLTLIFIGLNILLNRHTIFKIVLWISFLVVLILYASYGSRFEKMNFFLDPFEIHNEIVVETEKTENFNVQDAQKGEIKIELGACKLETWGIGSDITRIKSNMEDLNAVSQYNEEDKIIKLKIEDEDGILKKTNRKNIFTDIQLSTLIPWNITAEIGAIDAEFDMKKIKVDTLNINVGAGNVKVYLGENNTHSDIYLNGGASNIKVYIPQDCGVRVIKNGNLINLSDHFGLKEDLMTENFNEADTVYNIYLNANAANIALYSID